jgi:predicted dinucleotide-binding enzyme
MIFPARQDVAKQFKQSNGKIVVDVMNILDLPPEEREDLGGLGPETLADFVADLGPGATAGRKQAAECEVIILLKGIDWRGRILIDAANAHVDPVPDIRLAGVTRSRASKGRTSSDLVAEMAAGAQLPKTISNMRVASVRGTIS